MAALRERQRRELLTFRHRLRQGYVNTEKFANIESGSMYRSAEGLELMSGKSPNLAQHHDSTDFSASTEVCQKNMPQKRGSVYF